MPLNVAKLESELRDAMLVKTADAVSAAQRFARSYMRYAQDATAGVAFPQFTGGESAGLTASLVPVFQAVQSGSPVGVAAAWLQGILAFWTATPPPGVLFVGGDVPVPALPVTVSTVQPCLSSVFASIHSEVDAAVLMAACIDTATRGFIVPLTISGVPTPVPIM